MRWTVEQILAALFPPAIDKLGSADVQDCDELEEHGWAGNVRVKRYRDGIERTFAEQE
jgi:hypothetical protein